LFGSALIDDMLLNWMSLSHTRSSGTVTSFQPFPRFIPKVMVEAPAPPPMIVMLLAWTQPERASPRESRDARVIQTVPVPEKSAIRRSPTSFVSSAPRSKTARARPSAFHFVPFIVVLPLRWARV
jgi:hypothetical protein